LLSAIKKEGRRAFLFSFTVCAPTLAAGKADDMAPIALGRASLAQLTLNSLRLQLRRQRLARGAAFTGFLVKLGRLAGRPVSDEPQGVGGVFTPQGLVILFFQRIVA